MKKWVDLYQEKNLSTGFSTYAGGIGTDQPFYFMALSGKSAADFYSQAEKEDETRGEDARKLVQKTLSVLRKHNSRTGMYRPDLSYISEK